MKSPLRILLLILAFLAVGGLGYYTYTIQAKTIQYALPGAELQKGTRMEVLFSRELVAYTPSFPSSASPSEEGILVSQEGLARSLLLDGQPFTATGDISIGTSSKSFTIDYTKLTEGHTLTLKASLYNSTPGILYRLPKDVALIGGGLPYIETSRIGVPKERKYKITLTGFPEGVDPSMLKLYYIPRTTSSSLCDTSMIDYATSTRYTIDTIYRANFKDTLDITSEHPLGVSYCLFAGLSGRLTQIDAMNIEPFTLTGKAIDVLAPEYDMQSRIQFSFPNPIFEDVDTINSPEFIAHRGEQKIQLLKHLSITPEIPLTPDNIVLTPDRAILTGPFVAGTDYTIKLTGLEDIYGTKTSFVFPFSPKREPYLSLSLSGGHMTLPVATPAWARMYALDTKRSSHHVMLCKLDLENFARMERIVDDDKAEYSKEMYTILRNLGSKNCTKKEILVSTGNRASGIEIASFFPEKKQIPGLYVLAFADETDSILTSRWLRPVVFSLLDTHITMKLDAGGKAFFFVTDLSTNLPVAGQDIRIYKNIGRTHTETWNATTQKSDINYLPLTTRTYGTGILLGKTDKDGYLTVDLSDKFDGDSAYGFTYEDWWGYEGSYRSFLVEASSQGRAGYVVSTWNDGIAGWNFGFRDMDYGWSTVTPNLAYTHTDRRLYLPGETVNIHSIIRDYTDRLIVPPEGRTYGVIVLDSNGKEISRTLHKASIFGSLSKSYTLPETSPLGNYTVQVVISDSKKGDIYIQGGYTNFQVEVFKNPTFKSTVSLSSPDIDGGIIKNLKKTTNNNSNYYWYDDVYEGTFSIDGKIKADYYNGAVMRNVPFTYRIYRSPYWGDEMWNDCFWGCYYEPDLELYTEGEGRIDADGYGFFRAPVLFSSYYSDYKYVVEITIQDPLTTETVTSSANLIVRMPADFRMYDDTNPLTFKPTKKILKEGESLDGVFAPSRGKWSEWYKGKYSYSLVLRTYTVTLVDDIRGGKSEIVKPKDTTVSSGIIASEKWNFDMKGKESGEYHLIVGPTDASLTGAIRDNFLSDTTLYYVGKSKTAANPRVANNAITVISEKTVYKIGDTARVLVRLPWENARVLLTTERLGVSEKKYFQVQGNMFEHTFVVDDRFIPNAYIGVTAFSPPDTITGLPEYRVGYTEIVTDLSDKKATLTVNPNKKEYKTRETADISLELKDRSGNPLIGEVAVMVVDESLISLLGNIDLDVIQKFYQKLPFSVRTALSLIGMEERRYFSRKGIAGGGGDKGGGSLISTRSIFKNTAYYNPSIITDATGRARFSFILPDSITNYRIIAIANTKSSQFGVAESTINVRKDYVIEPHMPTIVRAGDTFTITANIFNNTKRITQTKVILSIDPKLFSGETSRDITLQPDSPENASFTLKYLGDPILSKVPVQIAIIEGKNTLDSITSSLQTVSDPMFENRKVSFYPFIGSSLTIPISYDPTNINLSKSEYIVDISTTMMSSVKGIVSSLLQYPYGCIEQTTSSTLPNALALSLDTLLQSGLDRETAKKNLSAGISRIQSMQLPSGGFAYWQGDSTENAHITPYIIRSLVTMRDAGGEGVTDIIDRGVQYLMENESQYVMADEQAERFWTLALLKNPEALKAKKNIKTTDLSFHGWVAYLYGLHLSGTLDPKLLIEFEKKHLSSTLKTDEYDMHFWGRGADEMIYARLLLDRGTDKLEVFKRFIQDELSTDWRSYYYSTQEKLQAFLTFAKYISLEKASIDRAVRVSLKSPPTQQDAVVTQANSLISKVFPLNTLSKSMTLSKVAPNNLYVTATIREIPKDPYIIKAKSDAGVTVTRTFQKIDERLGVDADGKFIGATEVKDNIFEKGILYRVRVSVSIPKYAQKSWTDFVVEDYLPGGWRPIQGNFQTTSSLIQNNTTPSWSWNHIESLSDRVFAHSESGYGGELTYDYFIRPESAGVYLLPPVTAYFMYHPEMRGFGTYQKVIVK